MPIPKQRQRELRAAALELVRDAIAAIDQNVDLEDRFQSIEEVEFVLRILDQKALDAKFVLDAFKQRNGLREPT
jgi:hypothetical protein